MLLIEAVEVMQARLADMERRIEDAERRAAHSVALGVNGAPGDVPALVRALEERVDLAARTGDAQLDAAVRSADERTDLVVQGLEQRISALEQSWEQRMEPLHRSGDDRWRSLAANVDGLPSKVLHRLDLIEQQVARLSSDPPGSDTILPAEPGRSPGTTRTTEPLTISGTPSTPATATSHAHAARQPHPAVPETEEVIATPRGAVRDRVRGSGEEVFDPGHVARRRWRTALVLLLLLVVAGTGYVLLATPAGAPYRP